MGSWRTRGIGFKVGLEKLPGGVRVADGGLLVDAEDECEVEGVGAVSEGLFKLAVDPEPFEGGGEVGLPVRSVSPAADDGAPAV
ncbi:hypothetical protein ACIRPR_29360 [Streptomyces griseoflavus]|uniref:hypothetical protein n=1 Tax=Streptomyces griseoflavus TaxID=35619 RepID=UPI0038254825